MLKKLHFAANDPVLVVVGGIGASIGIAGFIVFAIGIYGIICGSN